MGRQSGTVQAGANVHTYAGATAVAHGDPAGSNVRVDDGLVWLLDWDESRVDLVWHDLSNLGVAVLDPIAHARAQRLSDARQAINAWRVEPEYARVRLERLGGARAADGAGPQPGPSG